MAKELFGGIDGYAAAALQSAVDTSIREGRVVSVPARADYRIALDRACEDLDGETLTYSGTDSDGDTWRVRLDRSVGI